MESWFEACAESESRVKSWLLRGRGLSARGKEWNFATEELERRLSELGMSKEPAFQAAIYLLARVDPESYDVEENLQRLIDTELQDVGDQALPEESSETQQIVLQCECKVGLGLRLIAKAKSKRLKVDRMRTRR